MLQKHFGSKISEYRQNKGLTQEELAGRVGVTHQALSKWERGQKRYPTLISEVIPSKISYGLLTNVLKRFMSKGNDGIYLVRMIEILDDILCEKGTILPEEGVTELLKRLN